METRVCGCGCGFPITAGMRVHLINGTPYVLGCVSDPVTVLDEGPDTRPGLAFAVLSGPPIGTESATG